MTCEIDNYARVDYAEQKKAQLRRVNWNQNITRQINAVPTGSFRTKAIYETHCLLVKESVLQKNGSKFFSHNFIT
jgi:hypothetical protein